MNQAYLLDTHTLLWFLSGSEALSSSSKKLISNSSNKCYVSIASLWEIAIKINLGKLTIDFDFKGFAELLYENDIEILQITFDHILELMNLEDVHRDPFDRIIISLAKYENLSIITKDKNFSKYSDLNLVW